MQHTLQTLQTWLADPTNLFLHRPRVRYHLKTSNGHTVSIQQSETHYCNEDSVEMWCCPHLPILDAFGSGEHDPYRHVPLQVVVDYLNELEETPFKAG